MSAVPAQLQELPAELFLLDHAVLNFGIHRAMNAKRAEVTHFLELDLLPQVRQSLARLDTGARAAHEADKVGITQPVVGVSAGGPGAAMLWGRPASARKQGHGPMTAVGAVLEQHFGNLLAHMKHRITNAATEGLKSKVQALKPAARGFRNFANYRTRILFFSGKLSLYPQ